MQYENSSLDFFSIYEIEDSIKWIEKNNFKRVSLQFPEELYPLSTDVYSELEKRVKNVEFAIIAEKKHSNCCLDELGASHFKADCILHFGDSCLTPPIRFPSKFILEKKLINLEAFENELKKLVSEYSDKQILLFYNLSYHHLREQLVNIGKSHFKSFICPSIMIPESSLFENNSRAHLNNETVQPADQAIKNDFFEDNNGNKKLFIPNANEPKGVNNDGNGIKIINEEGVNTKRIILGRVVDISNFKNSLVIYVGGDDDDNTLDCLLLNFNTALHVFYDTSKEKLNEVTNSHKLLRKRYFLVEKAKDAKFIGILMQTFETLNYLQLTHKIKMAAKNAGKKARVFSPGVLNCAKLANMTDFELFVVVACGRGSLPDHSEFLQPIVTPYEFLIACSSNPPPSLYSSDEQSPLWSDSYTFDFQELIKLQFEPIKNEADVSLVTGKMRNVNNVENHDKESLQLSKVSNTVATIASERLLERSWQGLELNLGCDEVSEVKEGLRGTAAGYAHEKQ